MSTLDDLADRIERLVLRYEELQRTHALALDQIQQLSAERDSLKSRLSAARHRIDALLDRIPSTPDTANPLLAVAVPVMTSTASGEAALPATEAQAPQAPQERQDLLAPAPVLASSLDAQDATAAAPDTPAEDPPAQVMVLQQSSLLLEPLSDATDDGASHPVPVEHA